MLNVASTAIGDVRIIVPRVMADDRGTFSETYNAKQLLEHGISLDFIQDNHVYSRLPGTVRGLHFQTDPAAQAKLIRVVRGSILDVAVDIRRSYLTFGKWVSEVLSAENGKQLLIPAGFAHGYATLEPDTEVIYKVTGYWSPSHERGILWSDPDLAIDWKVARDKAIVAEKDQLLPTWKSLTDVFN